MGSSPSAGTPSKTHRIAVEELPTANGPADYGLFVGGQLLGIVEAKKVAVNPQNVLEQAKRYARGVFAAAGEWNGFRVPFLYSSNGALIWHVDTRPRKLVSRHLSDFHTPEALEERFSNDNSAGRSYLLDTPPEQMTRLRPYQRDSILAVEQAIIGGKRDMNPTRPFGHNGHIQGQRADYRKLLIHASTSGVSIRKEYPTPEQLMFVTYELTPSTISVPPSRSGPPESPKQVPPEPPPGFIASRRNSSLCTKLPEINSLGANIRWRGPVHR